MSELTEGATGHIVEHPGRRCGVRGLRLALLTPVWLLCLYTLSALEKPLREEARLAAEGVGLTDTDNVSSVWALSMRSNRPTPGAAAPSTGTQRHNIGRRRTSTGRTRDITLRDYQDKVWPLQATKSVLESLVSDLDDLAGQVRCL